MKIKLLKPVLILLTVLNVQLAWAQPNCIPTGSNNSATQLTYCLIGDDYDFTINNNLRHNNLSKEIVLDQQDYDMQFVFNNPSSEMLYIGMYLDLNDDGEYDYPSEMVFEGQSNGTNYSEVLSLTEAVLNQLSQGPKWMRMIVTSDQSSLYNTCEYPPLTTAYQAIDIRSGRLKIKRSTAQHDPGLSPICIPSDADIKSTVSVENNYEGPIKIQKISFGYGHGNGYCGFSTLLFYRLADGTTGNSPIGPLSYDPEIGYYWEPNGGFTVGQGDEAIFLKVLANECWSPIEGFELDVDILYDLLFVSAQGLKKRESFNHNNVEVCAEPVWGGGGGFTNGGSPNLALAPTVAPNPSAGNTTLNFGLETASKVSVEVYNLLGERVLIERPMEYTAGTHQMPLTTENLPVGTYLVNVKINETSTLLTKLIIAR